MDSIVEQAGGGRARVLVGRTAIVTGSTSGIGAGIADRLAAAGAHVVLNGFGEDRAIEALRSALEVRYGGVVAYDPADMSDPADVARMVSDAERLLGSVDILVNNA